MLTSTIAWCTPCVERARRAHSFTLDVVSHLIGSRSESFHIHLHGHSWAHLLDSPLPFYFHLFFLVFSFYLLHSELYPELDNLIVMESLCYSANKGSEDAYDVSTSLTGYEPNFVTFGELNDSSVPFSFMIPSSDQDMDDVTLGKLLTEAHRGQADYCEPEGMSVSQSSSVVFDGSGKPDGERNVDQSVVFGVTRNTYSAHSKFSENTRTEKMVDGSGKPDGRKIARMHRLGPLLEEQRQMIIAEYSRKSQSSRTPCSSRRRRAPTSTRTIMATEIGIS